MDMEVYTAICQHLTLVRDQAKEALLALDREWRNQKDKEARDRLDPIVDAINQALRKANLLDAVAFYDCDAGFDSIRVNIRHEGSWDGAASALKIEDSYSDRPRVGIYPPGSEVEGGPVPIFDLEEYPQPVTPLTLNDLRPQDIADTVVGLVRFALGTKEGSE